jgi:hypothetical protein
MLGCTWAKRGSIGAAKWYDGEADMLQADFGGVRYWLEAVLGAGPLPSLLTGKPPLTQINGPGQLLNCAS